MHGNTIIYIIGFTAQILFSARLLIQWFKSEKTGRVLSPTIFWQLSLIASFLLMVYGILRDDLVIILGQVLSYFVYIRNLQYKNAWRYIPVYFKGLVLIFPFVSIAWLASGLSHNLNYIISHTTIPMSMLIWGSAGQIIFTLRFIYQWYFSEKQKKSVLPFGFWVISLIGSLMIISYAIYRVDPVLFFGQIFGVAIYARNIFLHSKMEETENRKKARYSSSKI